ncbi:glutathione S-transferase family protein [bacterium]|nr:glutathione S-transferase family protein [bacterium]
MITLYQFKLSHYCEKVRWALDHKQLPYRVVNLMPGAHIPVIRLKAPHNTVPLICDHGRYIQDSTVILDYLDDKYPKNSLTPKSAADQKKALELEEYFDQEVGIHLRRFFYNTLLQYPNIVVPLLTADLNIAFRTWFKLSFPLTRILMRKGMNINDESSKRSEERLNKALDKLDSLVKKSDFLVGDKLSRADITAASLLAPLVSPKEHVMQFPQDVPDPLGAFMQEQKKRPSYKWVEKLYRNHR